MLISKKMYRGSPNNFLETWVIGIITLSDLVLYGYIYFLLNKYPEMHHSWEKFFIQKIIFP